MNRQILFRGKTIEKDEWVEGYLVQGQWYYADSPMTVIIPTDITFYPRCEISGYEDVDPNTVGQWTGLADKNGKKIFEGDILRFEDGVILDHTEFRGLVVFEDGQFTALCGIIQADGIGLTHGEIIGNIWDNPELLKEE